MNEEINGEKNFLTRITTNIKENPKCKKKKLIWEKIEKIKLQNEYSQKEEIFPINFS